MSLTPAVTKTNFEQDVLRSSLPVLVDLWAEWCGPCRVQGPILEEIAPQFEGKLRIVKLDVGEHKEIASEYSVLNIPTMILFKEGKEVDRMVGVASKQELQKWIQMVLTR